MYKMNGTIMENDQNLPLYNLKAVVQETALKPSTIRAWERRYDMPQPQRSAGGHRQYSQRDIDTLKWLISRQEEGMSISHAVQLWKSLNGPDAGGLLEGKDAVTAKPVVRAVTETSTEMAKLRENWVDACLAYDRVAAEQALVRAFALFPPEVVTVQLLQAGLSAIGEGWYRGEVSVQQEHFASAMGVQRLEMLIAATPPPTQPGRIIVASAEDDYHVFTPLLFTFLLRRRGWDVLYLGADMPAFSLAETVEQVSPEMLIVSAQTLSTATSLLDVTSALSGSDTIIGYGGTIFNMMPQLRDRIPAQYLGPTIEGAVPVVERLIRQHAANPPCDADYSFGEALQQYRQRRALIESRIWSSYADSAEPTKQLSEINHEVGGIITAALIFGDSDILSRDMEWIAYLMNSYKLSEAQAQHYIATYYLAAAAHLDGPAQIIIDWLQDLMIADQ